MLLWKWCWFVLCKISYCIILHNICFCIKVKKLRLDAVCNSIYRNRNRNENCLCRIHNLHRLRAKANNLIQSSLIQKVCVLLFICYLAAPQPTLGQCWGAASITWCSSLCFTLARLGSKAWIPNFSFPVQFYWITPFCSEYFVQNCSGDLIGNLPILNVIS